MVSLHLFSSSLRRWVLPLSLGSITTFCLSQQLTLAEIITVGPETDSLPTLSGAEQEKLDILQATRIPSILSTISPDGSTLVISSVDRLSQTDWRVQFLNVNTGELLESPALQYEVVSPEVPIQWVDRQTIRFVQEGLYGPWDIVSLNRDTGIVSHTTVYPTEAESGEILGSAPDFSRFALRVYEGTEDVIYLVSLQSLDRIEVARLPSDLTIQPPVWSDNGQQVVFVTSSIEERGLYERTPNSPNLLNPVNQDALGRTPPADNIFLQQSAVKVYDLTQPEPLQWELKGTDGAQHIPAAAAISPSGDRILVKYLEPATLSGRAHPVYLYPQRSYFQVYDLDGTLLVTLDDPILSGPLENAGTFVDDDTLLFGATVGTNRHFYLYELTTGEMRALPLPPGSITLDGWETSPDGNTLFYTFSSITQPPELFSIALDGNSPPQQLTQLNAEVAATNAVQVNPVQFSTQNGLREGFLIQPADAPFPPQFNPLVFWQQGGPGFSMVNEFAIEVEMPFNLLPNFGIPVLSVPLTGREGFGTEFYRNQADGRSFGTVDIIEGVEVMAQVVSQGWSTPDQLGITGCSYGGYYTAQAITRFPKTFAAANPQCSLLDAFTEWQLGFSSLLSYLTGTTPMEAPDLYQYISPLYNATSVETATMIFHGSDDFLQVDMARNFHDVIHNKGIPVMMYEFSGVGHSIFDVNLQRIAAQLQIDFFRQHLKPEAQ